MTDYEIQEQIDDLEYKGLKIIQRKGYYHFTSDSVILANLVNAKRADRILDMGTGSGIIAILLAGKTDAREIIGIDIQDVMVDMARRSVALNNLGDRVIIEKMDIKDAPKILGQGTFDIVVCNPPYTRKDAGAISENEHINICRREIKVTLQQVVESASKLINSGGYFYMVHRAGRLIEVIKAMLDYNLVPKVLYNIHPKAHMDADTIIIQAKKNASQGIKVKNIVVYEENNDYTEYAKRLYGKD